MDVGQSFEGLIRHIELGFARLHESMQALLEEMRQDQREYAARERERQRARTLAENCPERQEARALLRRFLEHYRQDSGISEVARPGDEPLKH